jgi:methyl-accepting chemotaxis protein
MKRFFHSLMFRILLLCVGLVLVSILTIQYFAYKAAETSVEDTIGKMAMNITGSVVNTIDPDQFEQLVASQDMNNEYYSKLKDELNTIRKSTGLKFLYTMSKTEKGDYIYVADGTEAGAAGESVLGDVEEDMSSIMIDCFDGKETYEFYESEEWGDLISGYVPIKNSSGKVVGMLGADFDASTMVEKLGDANNNIFVAGVCVLIGSILLALLVSSLMIKSLKNMQDKVRIIKSGDLTIQVGTKSQDEIGKLSRAFQLMVENMSTLIHNIRDNSENVLKEVESLNNSIDATNKSTEEITKIVGEIASGAAAQVDNIDEVEDSMKRVFAEVGNITDNIESVNMDSDHCMKDMQDAALKLDSTVDQINLVNNTVDSTANVMKKLEEKFKEVLAFSEIVTSISKQTNLLALNASIEAASAGEHGRGFAIVATEIKNLAKQSSDASKKINELILAVQEEINLSSEAIQSGVVQARDGVTVMSEVKIYLDKLYDSNQKINTRIKDVAAAIVHIEEDGRNVLDKTVALSTLSKELNAGTQQTSAETQEQYAIMEGIKNDLLNVKNMMEVLGSAVNQFKIN